MKVVQCIIYYCVHVFYRVHRTLYITACAYYLAASVARCFANLHAHVIFITKETKSCIDIDGLCMLINLQLRREGV